MPDLGKKMFEWPAVFKCVSGCYSKMLSNVTRPKLKIVKARLLNKCSKACCEKYGVKDEDCKGTITTGRP